MKTRNRRDAIVHNLRRNGTLTIEVLASTVGAPLSTVICDIAALRDEVFVIQTKPGHSGRLSLNASSIQTTARMSVAERFASIIGVSAMRAAGNLPFLGFADAGLSKIEKALPSDKIRDLRRLLNCL